MRSDKKRESAPRRAATTERSSSEEDPLRDIDAAHQHNIRHGRRTSSGPHARFTDEAIAGPSRRDGDRRKSHERNPSVGTRQRRARDVSPHSFGVREDPDGDGELVSPPRESEDRHPASDIMNSRHQQTVVSMFPNHLESMEALAHRLAHIEDIRLRNKESNMSLSVAPGSSIRSSDGTRSSRSWTPGALSTGSTSHLLSMMMTGRGHSSVSSHEGNASPHPRTPRTRTPNPCPIIEGDAIHHESDIVANNRRAEKRIRKSEEKPSSSLPSPPHTRAPPPPKESKRRRHALDLYGKASEVVSAFFSTRPKVYKKDKKSSHSCATYTDEDDYVHVSDSSKDERERHSSRSRNRRRKHRDDS